MFELLIDALKALSAYPPIAALAALVILGVGIWVMVRGERDRKNGGATLPGWSVYGPVHDAMTSVHNISEQSRRQIDTEERIEAVLRDILKETTEQRQILEMIRNESRLR